MGFLISIALSCSPAEQRIKAAKTELDRAELAFADLNEADFQKVEGEVEKLMEDAIKNRADYSDFQLKAVDTIKVRFTNVRIKRKLHFAATELQLAEQKGPLYFEESHPTLDSLMLDLDNEFEAIKSLANHSDFLLKEVDTIKVRFAVFRMKRMFHFAATELQLAEQKGHLYFEESNTTLDSLMLDLDNEFEANRSKYDKNLVQKIGNLKGRHFALNVKIFFKDSENFIDDLPDITIGLWKGLKKPSKTK
jgi:hypothetical protein